MRGQLPAPIANGGRDSFWKRANFQFEGLVTLTLTLDQVILHIVVHYSSTSTYMPNFTEIKETLWTDGHLRPALLGRLCRRVDIKSSCSYDGLCTMCKCNSEVPRCSKATQCVTSYAQTVQGAQRHFHVGCLVGWLGLNSLSTQLRLYCNHYGKGDSVDLMGTMV